MRIGIDIDDTTFCTVKPMLKYADIFEEEISGIPIDRDSFGLIRDRYYLKVLYGWDNKTKFEFFNKYYKNVLEECTMLPGANVILSRLKAEGEYLCFATARLVNIPGCDAHAISKASLESFGIPFDRLCVNVSDKVKFFQENSLELCIEDSFDTCEKMEQNNIDAILMNTKMNISIPSQKIVRAEDWYDIYDQICIIREIRKEGKRRFY